ncbi:probable LRR receptor-like serine/threonine-protein kinase At3g47570 [Camellia sinensis]|uniref:probable LRR receptor-like serine/threonine-protein kinase At3g47570 n=1 Tax=Camellia sinensis TaxID=4442 RepID=UPI001036A5C4|nr:probable LRR receptor-like serine/threonine-protein kinase At3g47570 [Camellia sinensis]
MEKFYMASLVLLLLLLVQLWTISMAFSFSNDTDLSSLLAFKSAIKIDPSIMLNNYWTENSNFCDWDRVLYNSTFSNLSNLESFSLENNKFHGNIPNELAQIPNLKHINFGYNYLTGLIPPALFNLSSLEKFVVISNNLWGHLPFDTRLWLPNLCVFDLGINQFTGNIPLFLFISSMLTFLSLIYNQFTGTVPTSLGDLNLKILLLGGNQLTVEPNSGEISFLTALTRSRSLEQVTINENPLNGVLPDSIEYFSSSLQQFYAFSCQINGQIPEHIGSLGNLISLILFDNNLSGTIPSTIKGMKRLQRLHLAANELEGPIPEEVCHLTNLGELVLQYNNLFGRIPGCIGYLSHLEALVLDFNALNSTIPLSLWSLNNLFFMNLSYNSLSLGPNSIALRSLEIIDFSCNNMSGNSPSTMGSFQSLRSLNLSHNSFWGPIPESFGNLITLDFLDLSNNNLSGSIPKSLEALSYFAYLNLSHNKLSGEIPSGGPFSKFTSQSFLDNGELCGVHVSKPCTSHGTKKSRQTFSLHLYSPNNHGSSCDLWCHISFPVPRIAFVKPIFLGLEVLARYSDGKIVAVKLLYLQVEGAIKSFDAECKYLSNGSFEKWLYSHNYCLDLLQRVSIILDVALASEYLHHGQPVPVIHCDLKPSNVLLDEDTVAHVGDFGIAKILAENNTATQTNTLGTFGYIAPEYGSEGRVAAGGDTCSYGIVLLETFIRKKPTDEMFVGELSLRQWVSSSLPNNIMEVVVRNLFTTVEGERR